MEQYSRITLTVYGVMVPMLRVSITVIPARYNCVSELIDVLNTELQRNLYDLPMTSSEKSTYSDPRVDIPPWTNLFFRSSRGYTAPDASHFIHETKQRIDNNVTAEGHNTVFGACSTIDGSTGYSTGLDTCDTCVDMAFRSVRAQEATFGLGNEHKQTNAAAAIKDTTSYKDVKDYFNDFILLKDTSLLCDGDEILIDDWADIMQMAIDRKNEQDQIRHWNAEVASGRLLVGGDNTTRVSHLQILGEGCELPKLDNSALLTVYRRELKRKIESEKDEGHGTKVLPFNLENCSDISNMTEIQKQHMIMMHNFLTETMMYHIKMVIFLSSQCNKEANIAAEDIAMVQFQNETVAESMIEEVTKEAKIVDPSAVLRILTQLAIQYGKGDRKDNDNLESEKTRQLVLVYRARIEMLERELRASKNIEENLESKILKIECDFQHETAVLKEELRRLEDANTTKSDKIHTLESALLHLQAESRDLSNMNERLFEDLLCSGDNSRLPIVVSDSRGSLYNTPALVSQSVNESIQRKFLTGPQCLSFPEEGSSQEIPRRSEAQAAAAHAEVLRVEETRFRHIIHRTADKRSFSDKVAPFAGFRDGYTQRMQKAKFQNNTYYNAQENGEISNNATGVQQGTQFGLIRQEPKTLFGSGVLQIRSNSSGHQKQHNQEILNTNVNETDKFVVQFYTVSEAGDTRVDAIEMIRGSPIISLMQAQYNCNISPPKIVSLSKSLTHDGSKALDFSLIDECALFDQFFISSPSSSWCVVPIGESYGFSSPSRDISDEGDHCSLLHTNGTDTATYNLKDPSSSFLAFYWMIMRKIRSWTHHYNATNNVEEYDPSQGGTVSELRGIAKKLDLSIDNSKSKRAFQDAKTQILRALPDELKDNIVCLPTPSQIVSSSAHTTCTKNVKEQLMDFFNDGFILFFRIYYVRYGKRHSITCDKELQRFLDPRRGPHYRCSVVEVTNAAEEFAASQRRRGLTEHSLLSQVGNVKEELNYNEQILQQQHLVKTSFNKLRIQDPQTAFSDDLDANLSFRKLLPLSECCVQEGDENLTLAEDPKFQKNATKRPFFKPRNKTVS